MKTQIIEANAGPSLPEERRMRSLTSAWLIITALVVFILVIWGATVRLTGSGLSIPDWPLIRGSLLPPMTEAKWLELREVYADEATRVGRPEFSPDVSLQEFRTMFWIEYTHRALAAIVGILFLAVIIQSFTRKAVRKRIEGYLLALFALLLAQAGLGGVVVISALPFSLIAIHLGLAFIFFGGLIWTALTVIRYDALEGRSRSAGLTPVIFSWAALIILFIQIFYGGLAAGTDAGRILNTFPLMAGSLFPTADLIASYSVQSSAFLDLFSNKVIVQFIHRWLPLFLIAVYATLRVKTARTPIPGRLKAALRVGDGLLLFQIVLGIGNLIAAAPPVMSMLHTATALLMFGVFVVIVHDVRYNAVALND